MHESKYRRPLQPTRNCSGGSDIDVFKFGTLCELIEWRRRHNIDTIRSAEKAFARAQLHYHRVYWDLPTFITGDGTPCDTNGDGIPVTYANGALGAADLCITLDYPELDDPNHCLDPIETYRDGNKEYAARTYLLDSGAAYDVIKRSQLTNSE